MMEIINAVGISNNIYALKSFMVAEKLRSLGWNILFAKTMLFVYSIKCL